MIAVLVGTNLILIGALVGIFITLMQDRPRGQPVPAEPPEPVPKPEPLDPKTLADLEEVKKRLVEEELAFQRLMSYNVDTAYGLNKEGRSGE